MRQASKPPHIIEMEIIFSPNFYVDIYNLGQKLALLDTKLHKDFLGGGVQSIWVGRLVVAPDWNVILAH